MEFERAAAVLEGVRAAPALGVAAPPAHLDLDMPEARSGVAQSRVRAARSWLFALGYLAEDVDSGDYDAALTTAVKAFQREAGLVVDGWIGEAVTWPRLQELVAFEHPLEPDFWEQREGAPKPALARAVATRLRLYGADATYEDSGTLDEGVRGFFGLIHALGGPVESLGLSRASWLAGVLDHDRHVASVVKGAATARAQTLLAQPDDDPRAVAGVSLLLNMAKIELWLAQGAETNLGESHVARRGLDRRWVLPSAIRGDMKAYVAWIDDAHPQAGAVRQAYRRAIGRGAPEQALIHFLDAARRFGTAEDPFSPDRLADMHAFYGGSQNRRRKRAEATVARLTEPRSLRARLWDGVRRIWSWLGRALKRVAETGRNAIRLARDIASYAFRVATEGFRHIFGAVEAFLDHVKIAVHRRHADPQGRAIAEREFGRDVSLLVKSGVPPAAVSRFTESLELSAQILRRACAILGRAVGLGISLAGIAVAGPLVLRVLIGAVRDLRGLLEVGREMQALRARYAAITAV